MKKKQHPLYAVHYTTFQIIRAEMAAVNAQEPNRVPNLALMADRACVAGRLTNDEFHKFMAALTVLLDGCATLLAWMVTHRPHLVAKYRPGAVRRRKALIALHYRWLSALEREAGFGGRRIDWLT